MANTCVFIYIFGVNGVKEFLAFGVIGLLRQKKYFEMPFPHEIVKIYNYMLIKM